MLAATVVAALLRGFRLGSQSLWVDEVLTWRSAGGGAPFQLSQLLENVHGPLYSLILHGWMQVAGESEGALRLPSAVLGVALVPAMAWLASRWLGRPFAAPAAWLTAGSPFLVWYAQEARNYTLVMLCAVVSSALLLGLRQRPSVMGWIGYVASAAAGLLSNFSFAFLGPVHLMWWIGPREGRVGRLKALAIAAAVLALAVLPWVPQIGRIWDWSRLHPQASATETEPALRGGTTFHAAALPFAAHSFAVGYTLGPSLRELRGEASMRVLRRHGGWLLAEIVVFGALGLLGLRELRRRGRLGETLCWLGTPALVVSYFALQNFKVFHPRYLGVAEPGFLLILAAGLVAAGGWRKAWIAALGALWVGSLAGHYFDGRHSKEDMRSAAALIQAQARPGEQLLAVNAEEVLFYYYRGPLEIETFWLGFAARPDRLERRFEAARSSHAGAWVVLTRPEDLDPRGAFAELMSRYSRTESFSFNGVKVWHLDAGARERGGGD